MLWLIGQDGDVQRWRWRKWQGIREVVFEHSSFYIPEKKIKTSYKYSEVFINIPRERDARNLSPNIPKYPKNNTPKKEISHLIQTSYKYSSTILELIPILCFSPLSLSHH